MILRVAFFILLLVAMPSQLLAKDSLGLFESWAAFRDPEIPRCYAIAKPEEINGLDRNRAYASIGFWPKRKLRRQFHIHLSRDMAESAQISIRIGRRRFELQGSGENAWSQNPQMDAAIVAALRSSRTMTVTARSANGGRIVDRYTLPGVATAMDAAALACAER